MRCDRGRCFGAEDITSIAEGEDAFRILDGQSLALRDDVSR